MSFSESLQELVAENRNGLLCAHVSWMRLTLSEIASIQNGFPFESKNFSPTEGTPVIRIRDVLNGETKTYYNGEFDEQFVVQRDDLLIGMDGDFHCSLWAGRPALLNQRVCRLTPNEAFYSKRFLRFVLPGYLSAINSATSSITVKHLSSRTVADIPLPLPPLAEQRRIVAKIEELFSDLDAGVAALKRAKANLNRYRAAVLKAAVEGKLTEEWRAEHPGTEPASKLLERILTERRQKWEAAQLAKFAAAGKEPPKYWKKKYKEPKPPDTSGLPELPKGWCWAYIRQSAFVDVGFAFKSAQFANAGIRLLRGENLEPGKLRWKDVRYWPQEKLVGFEHLLIREGQIILAMDRPLVSAGLKIARAHRNDLPCLLVQRMARLRLIDESFSEYLYCAMQTHSFIAHLLGEQTGTQLPHISGSGIEDFVFPLPPLVEQQEIIKEVAEKLSQIDAAETAIDHSLLRAARLRQSILKQAFEGKLVPQDPTDEPASVLLERVRASRSAHEGNGKAATPGRASKRRRSKR